jgi:hypothetical protein
MIVFGTAVVDGELYDRCALPGINRAKEDDSVVIAHQSAGTIYRNYNLMLDLAAEHEDLEALVLLHQDAEIVDDEFVQKVRAGLADPDVAVVGCAGAIGVRSIAWWEGVVTWASFTHRYEEYGGGQFDSYCYAPETTPPFAETGEVDSIDGFVIVLSPWAVRNLRFDESLGKLHGYDFDICCQAREAGKKVLTVDTKMVHHHSLDLVSDVDAWIEAYIRLAEKWDERLIHRDEPGIDWRQRALRSEAEAAAAHGREMAHKLKLEAMNREYNRMISSTSWRVTSPLRTLRRRLGGGERAESDRP